MPEDLYELAARIQYRPNLSLRSILYGAPITNEQHAQWRSSAQELLTTPKTVSQMLRFNDDWRVRSVGLAIAWLQHHEHHYDTDLQWMLMHSGHIAEITAACWSLMVSADQRPVMETILINALVEPEPNLRLGYVKGCLATYGALEELGSQVAETFRASALFSRITTPDRLQVVRKVQELRAKLVLPPPLT